MILITDKILDTIKVKIKEHHSIYPAIKLDNVYWESRLADSMRDHNYNVDWKANGHGKGKDLVVDGWRISCKGGTIHKNKLTISSHRTTRLKTIEEKIEFLKEDHEDEVYSLSKVDDGYILSIFNTPDFSRLSWEELKSGWKADWNGDISARITRSMSDQLWYSLNIRKIKQFPIYY